MNDYLWNRSGSDTEIEALENMLSMFAHGAERAVPVSRAEPAAETPRGFGIFRWSFSFAFAGLVIAAAAAFVLLPRSAERAISKIEAPHPQGIGLEQTISTDEPATAPRVETASFKPRPKAKHRKPRRVVKAIPIQEARPQVLTLTAEEADAYKQLMTALAITSTQLKIVKDKINGTED